MKTSEPTNEPTTDAPRQRNLKLAAFARRHKLTAREIARRTGVSASVVARVMKGGPPPNLTTAATLSFATNGEVRFEDMLPRDMLRRLKKRRGILCA